MRHPHVKAALCLAALVAAVYGKTFGHEFVSYDDVSYVSGNSNVLAGLTWEGLKYAFGFTDVSYWHPLPLLSHMADCELFGPKPGPHHLVSALFHLVNALLLYAALLRLTGSAGRSLLVAALFAVHPVNVESVAWVAERKNLISTLFWLLALVFYAGYAKRPSIPRYFCVFFAMMAGLLSKPAVMTLPFALLLLDYWPLGRFKGGPAPATRLVARPVGFLWLVAEKLPLMALSAGSVAITVLSAKKEAFGLSVGKGPDLILRLNNALVSYVRYLENAFWPQNLAFFYPFPESVPSVQAAFCAILLIGLGILFWSWRRKRPYMAVGYAWFLGVLAPMSGLVQSGMWPAMADRFAYLPYMGIFIATVWLGADLAAFNGRYERAGKIAAVFIVAALSACSFNQVSFWKNSKSLYERAINVTEDNFLAHVDLGLVFLDEGDPDSAIDHFSRSWAIRPDYDETAVNMGNAWYKKGDLNRAIFWYQKALTIRPLRVRTHLNMAAALLGLGRNGEAENVLKRVLEIEPNDPDAHYGSGLALARLGRLPEAVYQFRHAVACRPGFGEARNALEAAMSQMAAQAAQPSGEKPDSASF